MSVSPCRHRRAVRLVATSSRTLRIAGGFKAVHSMEQSWIPPMGRSCEDFAPGTARGREVEMGMVDEGGRHEVDQRSKRLAVADQQGVAEGRTPEEVGRVTRPP